MKKLIIILLLAVTFSAKSQTRYELYVDSIGYNHVSATAEPLVAIWGYFSNLLGKPTDLTGYGVTNTITINGTTSALSTNPSFTVSTSIPAIPILSKSANYTIVSGDFGTAKALNVQASGTSTITLPTATSFSGFTVNVTNASTGVITVSGCSYDNVMSIQTSNKTFVSNGTTWQQN